MYKGAFFALAPPRTFKF